MSSLSVFVTTKAIFFFVLIGNFENANESFLNRQFIMAQFCNERNLQGFLRRESQDKNFLLIRQSCNSRIKIKDDSIQFILGQDFYLSTIRQNLLCI